MSRHPHIPVRGWVQATGLYPRFRNTSESPATGDIANATGDIYNGTGDIYCGTSDIYCGTSDIYCGTSDIYCGTGAAVNVVSTGDAEKAHRRFRTSTHLCGHPLSRDA